MEYKFEVLIPEQDIARVPYPQMLISNMKDGSLKVTVYFMENKALQITGGIARAGKGRVKLYYEAISPSGAYTASVEINKVAYIFPNPEGMAGNFEFLGNRRIKK